MLRRAINLHNHQRANANRSPCVLEQSSNVGCLSSDTASRWSSLAQGGSAAGDVDESGGSADSSSRQRIQEVPLRFSSWRLIQMMAVNSVFGHPVFDGIDVGSLKTRVYNFAGPCPTGVKLLVCTGDAICTIFDVCTGSLERHIVHEIFVGLRAQAYWSPCGRMIATTYGQTVRITDALTGEVKHNIDHPAEVMEGFAWCPSGQRFATGGRAGRLRVFNAETSDSEGEMTLGLGGVDHKGVEIIAWSPSFTELAITARRPPMVDIVHVQSMVVQRAIPHTGQVSACRWSPCGQRLATGELEHQWKRGVARIIKAETGIIEHEIRHTSWVYEVAWSPCGQRLCTASSDGVARIINVQTGDVEHKLCPGGESIAWSPCGRKLAACKSILDHVSEHTFIMRTFCAQTWKVEHEVRYDGVGSALAWSPCGRKLAVGSHASAATECQAGWVYIINAETGAVDCIFGVQHGSSVLNVSFSR